MQAYSNRLAGGQHRGAANVLTFRPDVGRSAQGDLFVLTSQCSATCGRGRQTRRVFCLEARDGHWTQLDDVKCDVTGDARPADQQDCEAGDDCSRVWLTGSYSQVGMHLLLGLSTTITCIMLCHCVTAVRTREAEKITVANSSSLA